MTVFRRAPVGFATRVLGVTPVLHQAGILNSIRDNRRTLVVSCNSIGKDFIAAVACHWWLQIWDEVLVMTTAVTGELVRNVQWKEIRFLYEKSKVDLGGHMPEVQPKYTISAKRNAFGISTRDEPERLQGHHEKNILIIVTEASAVAPSVWDGIRTLMASGRARLVALTNPTRNTGEVWDICRGERTGWNVIQIGAFDMANLRACEALGPEHMKDPSIAEDDSACPKPYPFLITHQFERETANDFGEESDYYLVHILGLFGRAGSNQVIPLAWIDAAFDREPRLEGQPAGGLDVARMGADKTAYVEIDGNAVVKVEERSKQEVTETTDWMHVEILGRNAGMQLCIDDTGLGGGVAPVLKRTYPGVHGIDFASKASDPVKFANLPSELWWALRQHLDPDGPDPLSFAHIPRDKRRRVTQQLSGAEYKTDANGHRIQVNKRGSASESPDIADAFILANNARMRSRLHDTDIYIPPPAQEVAKAGERPELTGISGRTF